MGNVKTENNRHESVLKYPGSKWRLANWIISHFPAHNNYIEPFFGSGAVLFNKRPVHNEIANDIDGNVVNLFRVIREHGDELAALVEMTPYARDEHNLSYEGECSDVEKARRFLVRCWQGFGGKTLHKTGWARTTQGEVFRPRYWARVPGRILEVVERLKSVQFENGDALELIARCNNSDTLLYIDPPYLLNTRTNTHYAYEFSKEKEHMKLLEVVRKHKGFVVISAYDNELYNSELQGWRKACEKVSTNGGGKRVETLYISPNCRVQDSLFGES